MSSSQQGTNTATGDESSPRSSSAPSHNMIDQILASKTDALLGLTRLITVVTTFFYIIPLFGSAVQASCFQKAILANAATSALRLHQRLPNFRLNREYISMLVLEDSAHYLIYSAIFVFSSQVAMVLLPISLFAALHLIGYILQLLNAMRRQDLYVYRTLTSFMDSYRKYMLQMIALAEILLMPLVVFGLLAGYNSLLTPFFYYRFLTWRYQSRRNPYTRHMFTALRFTFERLVYSANCPLFVRQVVLRIIELVNKLAPPVPQEAS